MSLDGQALKLMLIVVQSVEKYLLDEANLALLEKCSDVKALTSLELRAITSFIPVADMIDMHLLISFDEQLLQDIACKFLLEDVDVSHQDCMDMAAEFNNIVLGLSMAGFDGASIFDPPGVITDEKKIIREENMEMYGITCQTSKGGLDIYFMGPCGSFDKNLNYIGGAQ